MKIQRSCLVCTQKFQSKLSPLRGRTFPSKQEANHPNWKGKNVGYRALHTWVRKNRGKALYCEECQLTEIPLGKKRYFQWANISHEYKRDLADWKQLCLKCHKTYDRQLSVANRKVK